MFKVSNNKTTKYSQKNALLECVFELNRRRSGVFLSNWTNWTRKVTIETTEKGVKYVQSSVVPVFFVNFEHISHLFLVFLLLTLNRLMIEGFEQVLLLFTWFCWPLCRKRLPQNYQPLTCSKSTIETLEKRCETCWMLTINLLEQRHWLHSGVFIVNFEQIQHNIQHINLI